MNMVMTDEEKIRVHFNGLTSALEQLRKGPRRNDIDPKTHLEIRAIELELDKIEDRFLSLQF